MIRTISAGLVCCGVMAASVSEANAQAIFTGDCARARVLAQERTVDEFLPREAYRGVYWTRSGPATACRDEIATFMELTQTSRSTTQLVFSMTMIDVDMAATTGTCRGIRYRNVSGYGDAVFTTAVQQTDGICSLVLSVRFRERATSDPNWQSDWTSAVIMVDGGDFVASRSVSGGFTTPIAFTTNSD